MQQKSNNCMQLHGTHGAHYNLDYCVSRSWSTEQPRCVHRTTTVYSQNNHGVFTEQPRCVHRTTTVCSQNNHGVFTEQPWYVHPQTPDHTPRLPTTPPDSPPHPRLTSSLPHIHLTPRQGQPGTSTQPEPANSRQDDLHSLHGQPSSCSQAAALGNHSPSHCWLLNGSVMHQSAQQHTKQKHT